MTIWRKGKGYDYGSQKGGETKKGAKSHQPYQSLGKDSIDVHMEMIGAAGMAIEVRISGDVMTGKIEMVKLDRVGLVGSMDQA